MTQEDFLRRVRSLEAELDSLTGSNSVLRTMEIELAVLKQKNETLEKDLEKIKTGWSRVLWIAGGGIITSAVTWILTGGLTK